MIEDLSHSGLKITMNYGSAEEGVKVKRTAFCHFLVMLDEQAWCNDIRLAIEQDFPLPADHG